MDKNQQPEALRLADYMDRAIAPEHPGSNGIGKAAAELRRQHARIAELEAELEAVGAGGVGPLRKRQENQATIGFMAQGSIDTMPEHLDNAKVFRTKEGLLDYFPEAVPVALYAQPVRDCLHHQIAEPSRECLQQSEAPAPIGEATPTTRAVDFTKPLETSEGEAVKWVVADVIEYKCARVCVDAATGLVYSSPYIGLLIRNTVQAGAPVAPQAPAAPVGLPSGWVPCVVTHEGEYPEEIAYGPQIMMDRLKKWLDRHFAALAAAPAQAQKSGTYAPIEPVSIIWHASPEAVDAAHWTPICEAEGITLEELRQGVSVGVDERGVETEFSQAAVLQSMRDMGFWGFVDTKTRTIHAWADPATPDSAIMEFLGHEIGHVTGTQDERDWEEELRADQYGGLVKMAHALLLTRPRAQEHATQLADQGQEDADVQRAVVAEQEANARLNDAAPELLLAVRGLMNLFEQGEARARIKSPVGDYARAAIAKATGGAA